MFVTTSAQPKRPMAVRRGDLDALFRDERQGRQGRRPRQVDVGLPHDVGVPDRRPRRSARTSRPSSSKLPNKKKELALSPASGAGWKFDSPGRVGRRRRRGRPGRHRRTRSPASARCSPRWRTSGARAAPTSSRTRRRPKRVRAEPGQPGPVRVEMKTQGRAVGDGRTIGKSEAGGPRPRR